LEDLGSSNGTWLDGARLLPQQPAVLASGDLVRLGKVYVWLEQDEDALEESGGGAEGPKVVNGAPLILESPAMRSLYRLASKVAAGSINVLLQGETGVGKDVLARAIHERSSRSGAPFMALNCAALTESLFESELFGFEEGAFTGASRGKAGLLETAEGGTVFLDEVGELSASSQAKLLRTLEDRRVLRLGALKSRPIDVRLIAATNRDLERASNQGNFRSDLYFRLAGVTLTVPPLRERTEEIEPLVRLFMQLYAAQLGRPTPRLASEALEAMVAHRWPGNIRELRNVIERAVLLAGDRVEDRHLQLRNPAAGQEPRPKRSLLPEPTLPGESTETWAVEDPSSPTLRDMAVAAAAKAVREQSGTLQDGVAAAERERILKALDSCAGNQTRAAKMLGVSRSTLLRKLDRHGISRPRKQS
jgi:transcriptional regulator with PAS, ATPase and Fis domain